MKATRKQFINLLKMALEDMQADVGDLMKHCEAQKESGKTSDYVCRENMTVYENLRTGIQCMAEEVGRIDLDAFSDIEELVSEVERRIREHLTKLGLAGGLASTLKRKMERIVKFLHEEMG